jgi:hypothetical protein
MKNKKSNVAGYGKIFLLLLLAFAAVQCVSAADLPSNPIAGVMHVNINTANSGGYYIKFDGGGLNALHLTTSTSDRYGQLTTTSMQSGTFYVSDTGGRGFFNNMLLMIALRKPSDDEEQIPDDFRIKIRSSGYKWPSTGILNMPPTAENTEYVSGAVDKAFTLSSFSYGPQKWKPAGSNDPLNYPIYGDQDMSDDEEFYLFFVDLKVGALGENCGLTGLTDNGMVKVEYTIENLDSGLVAFNTYGWCAENQANQGEGISWTNRVSGEGSSGYVVNIIGSGGGEGGSSSGKLDYSSDSSSGSSESWKPKVGNLNISSVPEGAKVYLDGVYSGQETNASFVDLPAGDYIITLELEEYESAGPETVTVKNGYIIEKGFNMSRGSGSCFISSTPDGADIFIDGKDTLWHTNSLITDIISGNHTVTVYRDGYEPQSSNVSIKMNQRSELSFTFGGEDAAQEISGASGESQGTPESDAAPAISVQSANLPAEKEEIGGEEEDYAESLSQDDGGIFSFITALFGGFFSAQPDTAADQSEPAGLKSDSSKAGAVQEVPETAGITEITDQVTSSGENPGENLPSEATGGLYVASYPDNLDITLNGVKTDVKTPHYFYGLKEGSHKVRVAASDAVKSAQKTVFIIAGEDSYVKLEPEFFTQIVPVTIQSKYFKDSVFLIEGEYPEYPFPSKVSLEKSGTFITVEKDGVFYTFNTAYREENSVINIGNSGLKDTVGSITVTTEPDGASVMIDGHNTGLITPCTVWGITEGHHTLVLSKAGYYPEGENFRFVNSGELRDSEYNFILDEYSYGSLFIDSSPPGSMIYLKGSYTGVKTPHKFEYIPIGSYGVGIVYNRTVFKESIVTVEPYEKSGITVYNTTLDI